MNGLAGIHEFTTYTVQVGATVTYTGDVEIRTTGVVTIVGTVRSTGTVTFRCASSVLIGESDAADAIAATGDISLHVGDLFHTASRLPAYGGPGRWITSQKGQIRVITYGTDANVANSGDLRLENGGIVYAMAGGVELRAAGTISLGSVASVRANGGDATLTGSFVGLTGQSELFGTVVTVQGFTGVHITYNCELGGKSVTVRGFAGDIQIDGAVLVGAANGVTLDSDGPVTVTGNTYVAARRGGVARFASYGSTLDVIDSNVSAARGGLMLEGKQGVHVSTSLTTTSAGNISISSAAGSVVVSRAPWIQAAGDIDVRSATALNMDDGGVSPSGYPTIVGRKVSLSCGSGGGTLHADQAVALRGRLTVLAGGPLTLRGQWSSQAVARIISTSGNVDLRSADLETLDVVSRPSGGILIESYSDDTPSIDAAFATIHSGTSGSRSGCVVLRARRIPMKTR